MRKRLITFIFLLVVSFAFGQKHEFYLQVMPHLGQYRNDEIISLVSTSQSGTYLTRITTLLYTPYASISVGMQSTSRLFYQLQTGAQVAYKHLRTTDEYVSSNFLMRSNTNSTGRITVQPTLALTIGYDFSGNNRLLIQSSLWSYTLGYEHTWDSFSLGLNGGKMFERIANRLNLGPGQGGGNSTNRFEWLDENSEILISAYVNLNLSSIFGTNKISKDGSNDSNNGTPKEF